MGILFLAGFGASERLGVSERILSLWADREGILELTAPFELSGVGLLGSRGDCRPPRVGRYLSEIWVRDGSPAASYKSSRMGF